jgi:hypothetical protein
MEALPLMVRVGALGRLHDALVPMEVQAATEEVGQALEVLAPAVLQEVKAAASPERAAMLAAPLGRLERHRVEVAAWQAAAAAHQLALADLAKGYPFAEALHRLLAASFGGPAAAWPEPLAVDASRSRCERLPALPRAPKGVAGRLVVRCTQEARRPQLPQGNEKTFEVEQALKTERIEGDLMLACGADVSSVRLSVQDVALETGARELGEEPSGAATSLRLKLDAALLDAGRACAQHHHQRQEEDCAALSSMDAVAAEARFAEHAWVSGAWAPCFKKWFAAQVGAELPALR